MPTPHHSPSPSATNEPRLSRRQRKALSHFETERDALFVRLEHDRLVPLDAATARRGRAAVAGAWRLLAGSGFRTDAPLPGAGILMPGALFVALLEANLRLSEVFGGDRPKA